MANGWTPERKARQAALRRTWRPWESSTGARTPEGKASVLRNDYKAQYLSNSECNFFSTNSVAPGRNGSPPISTESKLL